MKTIILGLLMALFSTNVILCQELQQIFYEDFLNNDFKWYTVKNQYEIIQVENGEYHLQQTKALPDYTTWIGCGFESSKDFSIEATFRFISGNNGGYGIIWGVKDEKNYGAFTIYSDGKFWIRDVDSNTVIGNIKKNASSTAIKTTAGSKNILKVTKTGNELSFHINGTQVFKLAFFANYGTAVGFCIDGIINVAVESVRLSATREYTLVKETESYTRMKVFAEDFNDNSQKWPTINDNSVGYEFKEGYYYIENKLGKQAMIALRSISLLPEKDYLIECNTKKNTGKKTDGYGLIFGKMGLKEAYRFYIASDGFLRISKIENGKNVSIKDWSPSAAINMGPIAENRLIILKKGRKLYFYINSVLVHTINDFSLPISDIGLIVDGQSKIGFDYFKVNHLITVAERPKKPVSR